MYNINITQIDNAYILSVMDGESGDTTQTSHTTAKQLVRKLREVFGLKPTGRPSKVAKAVYNGLDEVLES